jgi:hypothetical protein
MGFFYGVWQVSLLEFSPAERAADSLLRQFMALRAARLIFRL